MIVPVHKAVVFSTKFKIKMQLSFLKIPIFFPAIAVFFLFFHKVVTATTSPSEITRTDQTALLAFKSALSDKLGALSSWSNASSDPCIWKGVTCGPKPAKRVTSLDLESLQLEGALSPFISNITFLRQLHLPYNHFYGSIPQELGLLSLLEYLNLTGNSFEGGIPATLSACSNLQKIILGGNRLSGEIPASFSSLSVLSTLILGNNILSGAIPPLLGNSTSLTTINISANHLSGTIPLLLLNNSVLEFLDLSRNHLIGSIPDLIVWGSFNLYYLDLSLNNLEGSIPFMLGTGKNLITLDLSSNNLSQNIPRSLFNSSALHYLSLAQNSLTGKIPTFVNPFSKLQYLDLSENQLSGSIPPSLGNLSSLNSLSLDHNMLEGSIPESLGSISGLLELYMPRNELSGQIPSSLYNLSSISYIGLAQNNLSGMLFPASAGFFLPALQILDLQENKLEGSIPLSLCNISKLQILSLAGNGFSGMMPSCLGNLPNVTLIDVGWNQLQSNEMSFLTSLTNCSLLSTVILQNNKFSGELPASIGNFSTKLKFLWFGSNHVSGDIPDEIGNLRGLTVLFMNENLLTGSIPSSISNLWRLNLLDLSGNKLIGKIPFSIGKLTQLNGLYMQDNQLSGSIPTAFGLNWKYLGELNLSNNALDGSIPKQILSLSSLTKYLDLSHNSLSGPLPFEVGSLSNLVALNVSYNNLSGEIPSTIGSCIVLQYLKMERNFFQGSIPKSLINLKGIIEIDISHNNLSGKVPEFLEEFSSLHYLNLSFNNFEDEVPENGVFGNATAVSVTGNMKLCGGNPAFDLRPCSKDGKRSIKLKIIIPLAISLVSAVSIFAICILYRSKKSNSLDGKHFSDSAVTYAEIFNSTDGFSEARLIGSGSFGKVYRVKMLKGENDVAVKVLNLHQSGAMRSFVSECRVLRNARHRNLLKIVTLCSSLDSSGNDFKALVFQYMPNGSLERWLHPETEGMLANSKRLGFFQRLNIAIDVASALEYLHNNCIPPIVHCDLKPSNILLDKNMTAIVSDFGLAKIMSSSTFEVSYNSTSLMSLQGSIGYAAPEYGMGSQISWQGDVYSYGVLLLEILTGKRPTDDSFIQDLNLHKYVENAFPEMIDSIIDPQIMEGIEAEDNDSRFLAHMKECVVSLCQIGLTCSSELPRERWEMTTVVKELNSLRQIFQ